MTAEATMFYAYPSRPADLVETIEAAIGEVNGGGVLTIKPWKQSSTTGKVIIDRITQDIDEQDIFACDLTYLNSNVLFELGYAIGRSKRIWISLNDSIESAAKQYRRFETLFPIGYAPYANRLSLISRLYQDRPWSDAGTPTVALIQGGVMARRQRALLLYLKSSIETDASIALTQQLASSPLFDDLIIDDPIEVPWQPLDWYVQSIHRSAAVVVHLLSDSHKDALWHNAKCSLVAGIAHGTRKPLLMLAHSPFECPLDYRTLLQVHSNAKECRNKTRTWLGSVEGTIADQVELVAEFQRSRRSATELQRLSVGEAIAENEDDVLDYYFVETNAYLQALNGHQTIFVGRKGSGKTANLYAVAAELRRDQSNVVCIIKPVAYEVEGVLQVLRQSLERSERGFLVESMWKFLIYTELAKCLVDEMRLRPAHWMATDKEAGLLEFVGAHEATFEPPFSVRLQNALEGLAGLDELRPGAEQRARVSERLHDALLARLRDHLRDVLSRRKRVSVLIDNLDKAWEPGADIDRLSELIFGLLGVAGRIRDELRSGGNRGTLTLAVFLRSDIFSYVQEAARERDKLTFERLTWDDPELLLRVLEARFTYSMAESLTPGQIWERFFVPDVAAASTKQFIVGNVMSRPRDVIYLVRAAIGHAVNRGHERVEESDLRSAVESYSQFALDSLIVEDDPRLGQLEAVLYEFAGVEAELSRSEVEAIIDRSGVPTGQRDRYLDILVDLNFLGIVMPNGAVEYPMDERQKRIAQKVASSSAGLHGDVEHYVINSPFRSVLQID